ncbi:hypothetical protein SAMN05443668_1391 [Cryptosporangium aurantiacum]|uniref:Uncharacterized protein n=1 Tax=Cryptosporangium aurantiacum TaxID=134849 RepID=A0A1M7RPP4_9ACTN|nr:hypothetical protein SAMN05443668_1391 [Cryptosporangium aurantiacum]
MCARVTVRRFLVDAALGAISGSDLLVGAVTSGDTG